MKLNHININNIIRQSKAGPLTFIIAALFSSVLLPLSSCADKDLNIEDPDIPGIEDSDTDTYYMAVRIYNASTIDIGSRVGGDLFDSDAKDNEVAGKPFNKGLASENAIYTGSDAQPHYLLVFENGTTDATNKLEYLMPLFDWDSELNKGEDSTNPNYPTVSDYYYTFYASAQKSQIPSSIGNRLVMAVINASDALQKQLKDALVSGKTYGDILDLKLNYLSGNASDYLFFTDDSDKNNPVKYFTMSSSMVVPIENDASGKEDNLLQYQPSIKRNDFKWAASKEEAAKAPIFSLFLERIQSKYTLLFNVGGNNELTNQRVYDYVYFGDDEDAKDESLAYTPTEKIILTAWENFFPYEDTEGGASSKPVEFKYVTDYKRSPSIAETGQNPVKVRTTKNWKVNIVGWGVNAVEDNEYLFKNLDRNKTYATAGNDYYSGWNIPALSPYRNFWAEGANYTGGTYPDQYRGHSDHDFIFKNSNNITFKGLEEITPSLNYLSFDDLSNRTVHQYAPEHTFDKSKSAYSNSDPIGSNEYLRRNTHIIVAAQFLLGPSEKDLTKEAYDGFDPEGVYKSTRIDKDGLIYDLATDQTHIDVSCKLFMNNMFWTETAYKAYVVEYLGYLMLDDSFKKELGELVVNGQYNDGVIYVSDRSNATNPGPATGSYFELAHIEMENGDNMVYIEPNDEVYLYILNTNWDPTKEEKWEEEMKDGTTVEHTNNKKFIQLPKQGGKDFLKKLALSQRDFFAQHFKSGRMYYAIPVDHVKSDATGDLALDGKIYGSVRNHWYNFKISNINRLGTAVDKTNQKIVPNNLPSHQGLGVEMMVLPWHTISTDVDISGQRPTLSPDEIDLDLKIKMDEWNYQGTDKDL